MRGGSSHAVVDNHGGGRRGSVAGGAYQLRDSSMPGTPLTCATTECSRPPRARSSRRQPRREACPCAESPAGPSPLLGYRDRRRRPRADLLPRASLRRRPWASPRWRRCCSPKHAGCGATWPTGSTALPDAAHADILHLVLGTRDNWALLAIALGTAPWISRAPSASSSAASRESRPAIATASSPGAAQHGAGGGHRDHGPRGERRRAGIGDVADALDLRRTLPGSLLVGVVNTISARSSSSRCSTTWAPRR